MITFKYHLAALFSVLSPLGLPLSAHAAEVEASVMRYDNDGGYTADFYIGYNRDGKKCRVKPDNNFAKVVATSNWIKFDLSDTMQVIDGGSACLDEDLTIPLGLEVWGYVAIVNGEGKTCRKDKSVIYRTTGGLIKYKTKGTTLDNNRCRVTSWP